MGGITSDVLNKLSKITMLNDNPYESTSDFIKDSILDLIISCTLAPVAKILLSALELIYFILLSLKWIAEVLYPQQLIEASGDILLLLISLVTVVFFPVVLCILCLKSFNSYKTKSTGTFNDILESLSRTTLLAILAPFCPLLALARITKRSLASIGSFFGIETANNANNDNNDNTQPLSSGIMPP